MSKNQKNILITILYILPIFFIILFYYVNRFLIPDWSFDVINYHLFNGGRGIKNWLIPFNDLEFFPIGFHAYISLYDSIIYLFKEIVGYRLGTLQSLISYIVSIFFISKIISLYLKQYFSKLNLLKFFIFISIPISLEAIFEIASYYEDNLNSMVQIIAIYYFLKFLKLFFQKENNSKITKRCYFISSLFFGISLLGKTTSLIFVIPFIFISFFLYLKNRSKISNIDLRHYVISIIFTITPFLIYCTVFFLLSGNPIFPFYNHFFKSQFFIDQNYLFPFGPHGLLEIIQWPIFAFTKPERYGEIQSLFNDGKISLFFFFTLLLSITSFWIKNPKIRQLKYPLMFYFFCFFLWVVRFGYPRYGIAIEFLGGALTAILIEIVFIKHIYIRNIFRVFFIVIMFFLDYKILKFNLTYDYSARPTLISSKELHKQQLPYLFSKQNIYSEEIDKEIKNSDIILSYYEGSKPVSGFYTVTSGKDKPLFYVKDSAIRFGFTQKYLDKTNAVLNTKLNKNTYKFFLICFEHDSKKNFDACHNEINSPEYKINKTYNINNFVGYHYPGKEDIFQYVFGEYKPTSTPQN